MIQSQEYNIIESLVVKVGARNKFQYILFTIFGLKWFFASIFLFSLNFLFMQIDFTCFNSENGDIQCNKWVCQNDDIQFWKQHLSYIPKTLSYQFGLFLCNKQWVVSTVQSLCYWGSFAGYLLMPFFADNFGRKKAEGISWMIATIGLFLLSIAWNIYIVGIGLFLGGFGINSAITLHYTFLKQFVIGNVRGIMMISLQIMFSLGLCFIAFVAQYVENWRYLVVFLMLIPCLCLLVTYYWIQQTPEFSLKLSRLHLLNSLNRIAKINNRTELSQQQLNDSLNNYTIDKSQKLSILTLFKYKSLRLTAYCCGFINVIIEFIYDGTIFSLDRIGLNIYTDQIVIGFAQMFAALFANLIIGKIYRKKYTIFSLIVCAACTLSFFIQGFNQDRIPDRNSWNAIFQVVVLILLRFILSSFWGIFYVFVSELFPMQITSLVFGYLSAVGTVGASVSPYIRLASKNNQMIVITCICIIGVFHVLALKQTRNKKIIVKIQEKESQNYKSSQISDFATS